MPEGFIVVPDFVSVAEEKSLARELLEGKRPWLDKSHLRFSNTRQQEFGPCITDNMELVADAPHVAMPEVTAMLAMRVAKEAARLGLEDCRHMAAIPKVFCRVNHYYKAGGGYMHKHMDSKKCFGPVIACCSLLSDTHLNFYDTRGNSYGMAKVYDTLQVQIPRRSLYFMTGPARSQWQHGIRKDQCLSQRLSLTFRTVLPDAPVSGAPVNGKMKSGKNNGVFMQGGVLPMKRPAAVSVVDGRKSLKKSRYS